MIEEKEVNLENPIFVYYVNVEGYAPSKVADIVEKLTDIFKYKNVNGTYSFSLKLFCHKDTTGKV